MTVDQARQKRDDDRVSAAGYARMETKVSCVLTRFQLRSAWWLLPFYLAFRRVRRSSRGVDGLLQALFLVEDLRTCYTLSLWKDERAILEFGTRVRAHVDAANFAIPRTYRQDLERCEIWSAQFRLWAVSCDNLHWEGLDLEPLLAEQWHRRREVAEMGAQVKESFG